MSAGPPRPTAECARTGEIARQIAASRSSVAAQEHRSPRLRSLPRSRRPDDRHHGANLLSLGVPVRRSIPVTNRRLCPENAPGSSRRRAA